MKMFLLLCLLSVICSAYGQVSGDFWWLNNNASQPEPRAQDGQNITITTTTAIHNTTEEDVWCECVPWYLCNNDTINTDGAGILDIRIKNVEVCPANDGTDQKEVCCGSRGASSPAPPSMTPPPTPTVVVVPTVWCECVPERLCNNGVINIDGAGIIDRRIGNTVTVNVKFCPETGAEAEICCGIPPSESTTQVQTTPSPASSAVNSTEGITSTDKVTEGITSTDKVTIGPTQSPPGSQTGNAATSYYPSSVLVQSILIMTQFFVASQLLK